MPKCVMCGKSIKTGTIGPECSNAAEKQIKQGELEREKNDSEEKLVKKEDRYAFARKSNIQNQGEDIPLARRHLYHMYSKVEDIPELELPKYLTLKNLAKNEAPNLIKKNPIDSVKAKDILSNFPKDLSTYVIKNSLNRASVVCKKKKPDGGWIYRQVNLSRGKKKEEYEAEGWVCQMSTSMDNKELGQMYLDDYRHLKDFLSNSETFSDEMIRDFAYSGSGAYSFWEQRGYRFYVPGSAKLERELDNEIYYSLSYLKRANKVNDIQNEKVRDLLNKGDLRGASDEVKKNLSEIIETSEENKKSVKWALEQYLGQKRTKAAVVKGKESYDFYIHQERVGGRNFKSVAEAQSFLNEVGFRGIQFGNTLSDAQREASLYRLAEAVSDFREVVGVEDFSFNKDLAIAFGARGKGRAIAHYEPALKVINITKKGLSGGALAHEWGHALDFKTKGMREKFYQNEKIQKICDRLRIAGREQVNSDYWNSKEEMFARIFEKYVDRKFKKANRNNSFLVGGVNSSLWPTNEEIDSVLGDLDVIFKR